MSRLPDTLSSIEFRTLHLNRFGGENRPQLLGRRRVVVRGRVSDPFRHGGSEGDEIPPCAGGPRVWCRIPTSGSRLPSAPIALCKVLSPSGTTTSCVPGRKSGPRSRDGPPGAPWSSKAPDKANPDSTSREVELPRPKQTGTRATEPPQGIPTKVGNAAVGSRENLASDQDGQHRRRNADEHEQRERSQSFGRQQQDHDKESGRVGVEQRPALSCERVGGTGDASVTSGIRCCALPTKLPIQGFQDDDARIHPHSDGKDDAGNATTSSVRSNAAARAVIRNSKHASEQRLANRNQPRCQ